MEEGGLRSLYMLYEITYKGSGSKTSSLKSHSLAQLLPECGEAHSLL